MFSDQELERYSRQLILPEIDLAGQEKLAASSVLIIGAGGLGNPAALYLTGAGVGEIVIADHDHVEISNLHRQLAFRQNDCGKSKAQALQQQLQQINPQVRVRAHDHRVDAAWLEQAVPPVKLVLDCTDNFQTRNLINRACFLHRVPLVSAAAIRFAGQLVTLDFRQPQSPCLACLFGESEQDEESCSRFGILGPVVGLMGTLQALQAIKLLVGLPMAAQLMTFDGLALRWQTHAVPRDPRCPCCGS